MATVMLITTYNPGVIGPRYIGAYLKQKGHEVWLVHFKEYRALTLPTETWEKHEELRKRPVQFVFSQRPGCRLYAPYPSTITEKEKELLIELIREKKPDLIGFSLFSVTVDVVKEMTGHIKQRCPEIPVIWGGVHCIMAPQECIRHADIVCAGEGEEIVGTLLDHWEDYKAGKIPEIPGIWYKKNGEVIRSDAHPVVDVDKMPYPMLMENEVVIDDDEISYKMNEPNIYIHNQVYVFTERGCPYHCAYCIHSVMKMPGFKEFRRRSIENVMGEIEERIVKYRFRHLIIHDEILGINKEWVMEFCREFRDRFRKPYGTTFTGYVHALTTDEEMLAALVDAGLTRVGMGLQSGCKYINETVFDRIWKPEKIIALSKLLSAYHFDEFQIDMLTHNPFENDEHRRETLEFLLKLSPPFHTEHFSLVVYELTTLAKKNLPRYEIDMKNELFWIMLYIMAGLKERNPEFILKLSEDEYLKQNPQELEKFVIELVKLDNLLWRRDYELDYAKRTAQSLQRGNPRLAFLPAPIRKIARGIKHAFSPGNLIT